jgi:hypothetical protein
MSITQIKSLCRIIDINNQDVYVVVPSWCSEASFKLPSSYFDKFNKEDVFVGTRFFANVNIGAERYEDVVIGSLLHILEKPQGKYAEFLRNGS